MISEIDSSRDGAADNEIVVVSDSDCASSAESQDYCGDGGCGACANGCKHDCQSCNPEGGLARQVFRLGCGCFLIFLIIILALAFFAGASVVNLTNTISDSAASTYNNIVATGQSKIKEVVEECRKQPEQVIYVDVMKLVEAIGQDKWIVASLKRQITKHDAEFKKWVFKANLDIKADVEYQYYVSLQNMRVGLVSDKAGNITVTLYFDGLHLNTPVGYKYDSTLKRSYMEKVNEQAKRYLEKEFPQYLEQVGQDSTNLIIAADIARKSIVEHSKKSFLPLAGIDGDSCAIKVLFESSIEYTQGKTQKMEVK